MVRALFLPSAMIVIGAAGRGKQRHEKGNEPAHHGPAKEDVQKQDSRGVMGVPRGRNDGGEEIEDAEEEQEVHRSPHSGSRSVTQSIAPEFLDSLRFWSEEERELRKAHGMEEVSLRG